MTKRVFLVSILLILVGLSGCLEESESTGSTQSSPQIITLEIINDCENAEVHIQSTTLANGSTMETVIGINVSVYHAIYTPDVAGLAFGYDLNLDGSIDMFDNSTKGINNLSIPITEFESLGENFFLTSIAGIATNSGGITTQLVHVSNNCESLSGVNLAQLTYMSDDFSMYDFTVSETGSTGTTAGGEAVVYVSLDAGDDLSWSTVIVQLSTDGSAYVECTNPDKTAGTTCAVSDNDDGKWGFSEEVTISEGSEDLCGAGTCDVQVKILDRSTNKLIYESNEMTV